MSDRRPAGCSEKEWAEALAGVAAFVDQGWSQKAAACGWSEQELFALPSNWHRISETGAVWLVGCWEVVDVDGRAITIKPPWSQSQLKIYRRDTLKGGAT